MFFGELEETKALFDARGPPTPTLGARPAKITSEGSIVDLAPLSKVAQGLFDLVGVVAGASHLLRELAFTMITARQTSEREIKWLRPRAVR